MKRILRNLRQAIFGQNNYAIKRRVDGILGKSSPIIIEAGAHIGSDTREMSHVWPLGSIHAFEPIPEIYGQLVANTRRRRNVMTHPYALSNATGVAEIYVSSGNSNGSSSLLSPKEHVHDHPDVHFNSKIKIDTLTLDDWAARNDVSHVDFAWLDMQGFELPVLQASTRIFPTMKVIYMEVSLKEMYEGVVVYPELKEIMKGYGFRVDLEEMPYQDFGNVLFVKD
jgi:FkbM family methyltransferase